MISIEDVKDIARQKIGDIIIMKKSDIIHRPIYIDVPEIVEQATGRDLYKLCELYKITLKDNNDIYLNALDVFKALSEKIRREQNE